MLQGILLGFLTYGLFACGDASIKALGGAMPPFQVAFLTTCFAAIVMVVGKPRGERWAEIFRIRRPALVLLRAASGILAGLLGVVAFRSLPLAEAYALIFLVPFFATLLSALLLGEPAGWRRWGAVLTGLCGVLVVIRPGFRELLPGHFAAAGVALCSAVTIIVLRVLGPTERRISLLGVTILGALVVNGALTAAIAYQPPGPRDLLFLALAGTLAGLGQIGLMAATRLAPANRVAPAQYSQIVWAIVLGMLFFGERPDALALAGMALVALSGLAGLRSDPAAQPPIRNRS